MCIYIYTYIYIFIYIYTYIYIYIYLYLVKVSALELKVNKQKKNISHSVPKNFDFFQNFSVLFYQATFYHPVSYVLLINQLKTP